MFTDDTIAAISTPLGHGGIGIVRLSGTDSIRIADTIFLSPKKKKTQERYKLPEFDTSFIDSPIGALAKVKGEIIRTSEFAYMNLVKTSSCLAIRDDDILGEREAIEESNPFHQY